MLTNAGYQQQYPYNPWTSSQELAKTKKEHEETVKDILDAIGLKAIFKYLNDRIVMNSDIVEGG